MEPKSISSAGLGGLCGPPLQARRLHPPLESPTKKTKTRTSNAVRGQDGTHTHRPISTNPRSIRPRGGRSAARASSNMAPLREFYDSENDINSLVSPRDVPPVVSRAPIWGFPQGKIPGKPKPLPRDARMGFRSCYKILLYAIFCWKDLSPMLFTCSWFDREGDAVMASGRRCKWRPGAQPATSIFRSPGSIAISANPVRNIWTSAGAASRRWKTTIRPNSPNMSRSRFAATTFTTQRIKGPYGPRPRWRKIGSNAKDVRSSETSAWRGPCGYRTMNSHCRVDDSRRERRPSGRQTCWERRPQARPPVKSCATRPFASSRANWAARKKAWASHSKKNAAITKNSTDKRRRRFENLSDSG